MPGVPWGRHGYSAVPTWAPLGCLGTQSKVSLPQALNCCLCCLGLAGIETYQALSERTRFHTESPRSWLAEVLGYPHIRMLLHQLIATKHYLCIDCHGFGFGDGRDPPNARRCPHCFTYPLCGERTGRTELFFSFFLSERAGPGRAPLRANRARYDQQLAQFSRSDLTLMQAANTPIPDDGDDFIS